MRVRVLFVGLALYSCAAFGGGAWADGSGDPAAVKDVNGQFYDKQGNPTFKVEPDGKVDWYTYVGYRSFNSNCFVCHGPDGSGSSYAPDLTNSLKTISYSDFLGIVAQGRQNVNTASNNVMPAFGDNKNVVCTLDGIYVYLRARANGAVGRGRPAEHLPKPPEAAKAEADCMAPS